MKRPRIFTSKQEAELDKLIKQSTNAVMSDQDNAFEHYMGQLGSNF